MKYTFSKENLKKIGKGALIAMGGALTTYVAAQLELIDWTTVGKHGYIIAPIIAIIINALRQFFSDK